MTTTSTIFKELHDAGLILIPMRGFSKQPRESLDGLEYNPSLKIQNTCNYSILLRHGLMVIDVDPRSFRPGDKPLARLWADLKLDKDILKATFSVRTPRGGFHFYFKRPASVAIRKTLPDYPGLEFLSTMSTAPGSWNEDVQKPYEVHHGGPESISPAPSILLSLLTRPDPLTASEGNLQIDHPVNIKRYADFLASFPAAVEGQGGDNQTFKAAVSGRDYGISPEKCLDMLVTIYNPRCNPPWGEDELEVKVDNAYNYGLNDEGVKSIEREFPEVVSAEPPPRAIGWDATNNGTLKKTLNNVLNFLEYPDDTIISPVKGKLRMNLFSNEIEFKSAPPWFKMDSTWTDEDAIHVKQWLSTVKHFDVPVALIHEAALYLAGSRAYHPVREYLTGLHWDGKSRLSSWLSTYAGADQTEFTAAVGLTTLVAGVARIFQPGIKFDYALVLEGDEGVGKSHLCRTLAEPWFTDAPFDNRSTSAIEVLAGNWIVELAEMEVLTKFDSRAMRGFISRQVDRARPAYGRVTRNFPRQCIFIGTINPESEGWLRDSETNRRYWPVWIRKVDIPRLKADRDQLWAEAVRLYQSGSDLYLSTPRLEQLARIEVRRRQAVDPWSVTIQNWLDEFKDDTIDEKRCQYRVTINQIYVSALGGDLKSLSLREAARIGMALKSLGFRRSANSGRSGMYWKDLAKF